MVYTRNKYMIMYTGHSMSSHRRLLLVWLVRKYFHVLAIMKKGVPLFSAPGALRSQKPVLSAPKIWGRRITFLGAENNVLGAENNGELTEEWNNLPNW